MKLRDVPWLSERKRGGGVNSRMWAIGEQRKAEEPVDRKQKVSDRMMQRGRPNTLD